MFLPADSDYDSSDALSPRDLDLLYSPPQELSQQASHLLGGSAPDVLQIHELRWVHDQIFGPRKCPRSHGFPSLLSSVCSPKDVAVVPASTESRLHRSSFLAKDFAPSCTSPFGPLSPTLSDTTKTLEGLSLSRNHQETVTPLRSPANPAAKRKLLSRSHRGQYFSGPHRWLRGQSGDCHSGSLSEGTYTKQVELDSPPSGSLPSHHGPTYVCHASCVLESRKGQLRELRPHVRKIFVEPCKTSASGPVKEEEEEEKAKASGVGGQVECGGEEPEGASNQEVDSDEQTNAQMSEILSSTL